jgi:N-acetyl-gamma-glutamyl-phosphate reductase
VSAVVSRKKLNQKDKNQITHITKMKKHNIGIIGASGYTGSTLLGLLLKENDVEIKIVTSNSLVGKKVSDEFPEIKTDLVFTAINYDELNKLDLVFIALPHGMAKEIAPKLKTKVIDFSADHRLTATYGMPELFKQEIQKAKVVANPGCYATACILSAYPIKEMIDKIVLDGVSGYSGGGKNAKQKYDYEENVIAYSIADHFHKAEVSKMLGKEVTFTPHVVDTFKGLMVTAHIFLNKKISKEQIIDKYKQFYKNTNTKIVDNIPTTKEVVDTPFCHIGGFEIDANNCLVVVSVIDNLMKGASSQAVENMKIMFN